MDRIEENCLVALVHEFRTDSVEKAHPINRLDVPVDRVLIERLILLLSDVDEYGVFFNALITLDADLRNDRGLCPGFNRRLCRCGRNGQQR